MKEPRRFSGTRGGATWTPLLTCTARSRGRKSCAGALNSTPCPADVSLSQALVGIKQNRTSYLLVEQDGVLLGEGFTQKSGHDYFTIGLALIARGRGRGIGTRLMDTLEMESHRLGARKLYLTVWSANAAGIHVYRKAGYVESGRRPDWVLMDSGDTCDLVDMVKILDE